MTARVIFLNHAYYPTPEEMNRLDFIQEQLELYHAELYFLSRDWDQYKQIVFKESSHQNVRKSWRLLSLKDDSV